MKRLLLIRHAKSDWSDPLLHDFERGLNKRGKRDAPKMGALIASKNIIPDLVLSSSAIRAKKTAKRFLRAYTQDIPIRYESKLYDSSVGAYIEVIQSVDESVTTLFVFGHNTTLNELSFYLSGEDVGNIPTCGVVEMEFLYPSWRELGRSTCQLVSFEYPKKYANLE